MARHATSKAVGWSSIDQVSRQGLQLITSMALARLLSPEEFGIVAMLAIFIGVSQLFVDGGMSAALIQRRDTTQDDESTVFWFNLASGSLCAAAVFAGSGWIARFYEIPALALIAKVFAAQILIGACVSIHGTLFVKKLDFRTPFLVTITSMLISGIVAIYLAMTGWGVWALVTQGAVQAAMSAIMIWFLSPWRPTLVFKSDSFRKLFKFGGFFFAARLLDVIYKKSYGLLLGKWYSPADLGLYNRADSLKTLPSASLSSVIERVSFPLFSAANHDMRQLRAGFRKALRFALLINTPAMVGLIVTAEPLISALFGAQWLPSAPILQILGISGILFPLHLLNLSVLQALGHSSKFLKLELIKKTVGITLLVVGLQYGAMGLAYSMVASSVVAVFINTHYTRVYLDFGTFDQLWEGSRVFLCSALMAGVVLVVNAALPSLPVVGTLSILVVSGAVAYGAFGICFCREELIELSNTVRVFFTKSKPPATNN